MDKEQRERMARMSGDNEVSKFPAYVVPSIRFNGNTGEFRQVVPQEKAEAIEFPLLKPLSVIIIKKKKTLSAFSKNESWFTSEFTSPNEFVHLYSKVAGKVSFVENNTVPTIREKYQNLRTHEIIYCLLNGGIGVFKLELKGASLSPYWDYQKNLREEDIHSFEVATILNSEKQKNEELGTTYYKVTFTKGEVNTPETLKIVEEKMTEVDGALKKIDDYYAQRGARSNAVPATLTTSATIKDIDYKEGDGSDIPF